MSQDRGHLLEQFVRNSILKDFKKIPRDLLNKQLRSLRRITVLIEPIQTSNSMTFKYIKLILTYLSFSSGYEESFTDISNIIIALNTNSS